ncbi:MAG TPA: hypothetical protein RMG48_04500 [Myxococcales bacterium LLY-WYZ-16_1]|jgi:hypothetical protein|nr:hypothetical protein [Myxococcales bacterium LLY-WYZ-16_1]
MSLAPDLMLTSPPTGALRRVDQVILQEPLVASRASRLAIPVLKRAAPPQAVYVGIGLCTPKALSRAVPIDLLGLLLPAEVIRRALGAPKLVVLVADAHAQLNPFDPEAIRFRSNVVVRALLRIRERLGFGAWSVLRASEVAQSDAYRRVFDEVRERSRDVMRPYMVRQVADVVHFHRQLGGVLKVGWVLRPQRTTPGLGDEMAFDRQVQPWTGETVPFVYAKPGRTLDDRAKKAPPYVEPHPGRRILLDPREDVARKLAQPGVNRSTLNGVKKHLRALTHTWSRVVEPVRGDVAERTQAILRSLYGVPRPTVVLDFSRND